ncbi:MAG TPA: amino acid adenylation domain-containing protein, partial [Thermoanaerobaculia bacterium]
QVESRQFEHVPLPEVQGWSEVPRKAQLFESLVIFENYPPGAQAGGQDASLELADLRLVNFTNYPLVLLAQPGRRLTLHLDVDRARFGAEAPVLLARLADLLERMARQRPDRLGDLLRPSPPELQQILREWNDSAAQLPAAGLDLAEVLAAQAAERPEAVAALCADRRLTYRELAAGSERLARALAAEGVGPESRVALLAERSLDFLVAILGIFRAGGSYLPLDPRHPRRRLTGLLASSGVELAIADRRLFPVLAEAAEELPAAVRPRLHVLEELPALAGGREVERSRFEPRRLAYLLYTSGSTGTPKGVMIEQGGMLNHLWAKVRDLGLGPDDVVAQTASQSFDISVWQFLAALLAGGSVHVFPDEVAHDPRRLFAEVESRGITVLETVPSLLRLALEELERQGPGRPALQRLRWLIPTGEALPVELCGQWLRLYPGVPLLNAYGPTECSDDITHHPIRHGQEPVRPPTPIGRPVANLRAYVLDGAMAPLPAGVAGELFVGGAGVGRGYLGDGARTAEAFLPDPFAGERGQRLYRTGDLARFRPEGRLDFLGRIDHQVKIRGHRIELGEIESVLASHPRLRAAVVLAREDGPGDRRLVAYLVPRAGLGMAERDLAQVRDFLSTQLPEAMVPSVFVVLDELPLSPNGKLDRKALPAPDPALATPDGPFVPPQGPIEELVAEIWAGVLRVERVGARDDFFDLGGHSLLATQVTSRVRSVLGVELPLRALFEDPTVAALARRIERERGSGATPQAPPLRPAPRDGDLPLSFAQQRLWFLDQLQPGTPLYNIPLSVRLTGPLDPRALEASLGRIVARHESLRTTFPPAGGQPVQRISPPGPWRLPQVDLQALPEDRRRPESLRLAAEESRLPFDLTRGPLLRAALLRLGDGEHAILLTQHHIVSDGWSVRVLMRELAALYPALAEGRPDPLPPLPLQYPDFAVWQRSWLKGETLEREIAFW